VIAQLMDYSDGEDRAFEIADRPDGTVPDIISCAGAYWVWDDGIEADGKEYNIYRRATRTEVDPL
jgi:hypothetical protein